MELERWRSQLWKGASELAVLALLERGESYGVRLLETLGDRTRLGISEGTIYPLLNRLQSEGKLVSRWVEDPGATHPRKYYRLTPAGDSALAAMRAEWETFRRNLTDLLEGHES